jgi:hypothetical protein
MSLKPNYTIDDNIISYLVNHNINDNDSNDDKKISLESIKGFDGLFDKSFLKSLQKKFDNGNINSSNSSNSSNSNRGVLHISVIRDILLQKISIKHADMLCRRLDINNTGYTKFSTFINCLISAEEGERWSLLASNMKYIKLDEQVDDPLIVHKDSIISMCYFSKPNPLLCTAGLDGQILLWNPVRLDSHGYINHIDKSIISKQRLLSTMSVPQKARCSMMARLPVKEAKGKLSSKMSITCMCSIPEYSYVIVGSTDQSIGIYDITSKECCGRVVDLSSIPTALCTYKVTLLRSTIPMTFNKKYSESINDDDDDDDEGNDNNNDTKNDDSHGMVDVYRICIGLMDGSVTIIELDPDIGTCTDAGSRYLYHYYHHYHHHHHHYHHHHHHHHHRY